MPPSTPKPPSSKVHMKRWFSHENRCPNLNPVLSPAKWCLFVRYQIVILATKMHKQVLHLIPLLNSWLIIKMQPVQVFSVGINLLDFYLNWLNWFHFLFLKGGQLVILIDCIIYLSPFLDVTRMSLSTIYFLAQLDSGIFYL